MTLFAVCDSCEAPVSDLMADTIRRLLGSPHHVGAPSDADPT